MPAVLNPLDADKSESKDGAPAGSRDSTNKPITAGNAREAAIRSSADMGSMQSMGVNSEQEPTIILKNDIEKFAYEELTLEKVLIDSIAAKTKDKFVDPFSTEEEEKKDEDAVPEVPTKPGTAAKNTKGKPVEEEVVEEVDDGSFRYRLGKKQYKDADQGDLGCLYKEPEVMPRLFFIRASFCSKLNAQMPHEELKHIGKSLKQFYITTGLGIAYCNDFQVDIYNIQKPSRDNVIPDYTQDYFAKVITARRINVKKAEKAAAKPEKTLAALIKSAREKAAEKTSARQTTQE